MSFQTFGWLSLPVIGNSRYRLGTDDESVTLAGKLDPRGHVHLKVYTAEGGWSRLVLDRESHAILARGRGKRQDDAYHEAMAQLDVGGVGVASE